MEDAEHKKLDKKAKGDLRRAITRALKKVIDSTKREPSIIILSGNSNKEEECPTDEITSWLFRRRQDDGGRSD